MQNNITATKDTYGVPVTMRVISYVVLSLFLLFFYFASLRILGIAGVIVFPMILGISTFMGMEFFMVLFLISLFMQNILVASMTVDDPDTAFLFSLSIGTSFFITCLFALYSAISWLRLRKSLPPESKILLRWTLFFSLVAIFYSGLGLISSDFKSVVSYLRVYLGAVMLLCIGIATGYRISMTFLASTIRVIAAMLVIWGIVELLFTRELLDFFNVLYYMRMKYLGMQTTIPSLDVLVKPTSFLNLSGQFGLDIKVARLGGPNVHPISYAYELAFCSLICFMYNSRLLALACVMMLVLAGSKGAIVETLMSLSFCGMYFAITRPRLLLVAVLGVAAAYTATVIYYGLVSGDFHVLGLIGSVNGFLSNPIGRGVGVGGNMSTQVLRDATLANLQKFQHQGASDFALESGLGVMLYQLGIASVVFMAFYYKVFKNIWGRVTLPGSNKRMVVLPIALVFVLVNALFQEEALSPASIGLWLFFSGFFLADRWREEASQIQSATMVPAKA